MFDSSNYANNGTTNSTKGFPPQFTASGKFGGAFDFDGKDDYIEVNDSFSLGISGGVTLEAWVNIGNLSRTSNRIITKAAVNGSSITTSLSTYDIVIVGRDSGDSAGSDVSSGDLNNDGIDDLIIGTESAAPPGGSSQGEVYVVYGPINLSTVLNVTGANVTFFGENSGDTAGMGVGSGDLNNDGIDDVLIGAPNGAPPEGAFQGEAYIIYGPTNVSGSFNLSRANVTFFGIKGIDRLGQSVRSGDFNNDGIDDLIVGASIASTAGANNEGASYLIFGPINASGTFNVSDARNMTFTGIDATDGAGAGGGSGDLNNDGIDDLIIGAADAERSGAGGDTGETYVLFGPKQLIENYNLMISEKGAAVLSFQNASGKVISVKTDNNLVTTNAFHHIAGVVDTGNNLMSIYVDGVQKATKTFSGTPTINNQSVTIGSFYKGLGSNINGTIDEVAVWNTTLSETELANHYKRGALKLNLSYRTSDDNVTFTTYTPIDNSTLSRVGVLAKYFQYRANLTTDSVDFTPYLQNVTINYTGIFTDSFGNYSISLTALSTEGIYEVKVNTTFAGISNEKNATLSVDANLPTITLNAPADNSFTNLTNINFTWTAADTIDTSLNCNLTIDNIVNASNIASASNTATNFTVRGLTTDATYKWNVSCVDDVDNANASATRNFTIDTTFPRISYSGGTESNNAYASRNSIFVNVTFTEANFNNLTFFLFDSSRVLINETNFTNILDSNISFNFTDRADGTYYYNVTIRDKASNTNSTDTRNITLDTTFPTIRYSGGTENNDTFFNRNFIFVNVSFTETNFNNLTFFLYNSNSILINETNYTGFSDLNASINFSNLADGAYYYNATIRDKASNINSTDTRNITLDTTFPKISFSAPTEPHYANKSQNFIFVNISFTEINFNNMTFYLYDSSLTLINETNY